MPSSKRSASWKITCASPRSCTPSGGWPGWRTTSTTSSPWWSCAALASLDELPPDSPLCRELEQIRGAGRQGSSWCDGFDLQPAGAGLAQHRRSFGRGSPPEPMLRRLPAHITLHVEASESEPVGAELAHGSGGHEPGAQRPRRDAGGGQLAVTVRSRPVSETEALSRPRCGPAPASS